MAGLKINFTEVKETSFELLPAGKYLTTVASYEVGEVKNPGKDAPSPAMKIEWTFTICPTGNELTDKFAGRNLWTTTTLYGGGLGRLKNLLKSLGYNVEGELDLETILPQVVNKQVLSTVRVRAAQMESDGKTEKYPAKNDISGWAPTGDGVSAISQGSKSLLPG